MHAVAVRAAELRGESESARVTAACYILDRGWGKAAQSHTGENGEGGISGIIRHIVEGAPLPAPASRTIDHVPTRTDGGEQQ